MLFARYGRRPVGNWVVCTTTIGMEIMAMEFAWSQNGYAYFISTGGKTYPVAKPYVSCFEDETRGGIAFKVCNRPHLVDFYYEYSPLLDEHNKQHSSD